MTIIIEQSQLNEWLELDWRALALLAGMSIFRVILCYLIAKSK